MSAQQTAADFVSIAGISPPPNPPNILPVNETDGKHVAEPPSVVTETKLQGTTHPTLAQTSSMPVPVGGAYR
jgi:hypothetical protein